jgi:hypothetical protein
MGADTPFTARLFLFVALLLFSLLFVILALLWVLTKDVEVADVFDFVLFK